MRVYKRTNTIGRTKCGVTFAVIRGPWYPAEYYGGAIYSDNTPQCNETHFYKRDVNSAKENAERIMKMHMAECASCAWEG